MSLYKKLQELTDDELVDICDNFTSASEYLRSLGYSDNGRYLKVLTTRKEELGLEWKSRTQHKKCLGCGKLFKPSRSTQTTCSKGCSNSVYRSGINHYTYSEDKDNYRTLCFAHNEKKCVVCGEANIVAVHHYDENHNNNEINNLVPLCPTHHQYMHSKYKPLISDIVDKWVINKVLKNLS